MASTARLPLLSQLVGVFIRHRMQLQSPSITIHKVLSIIRYLGENRVLHSHFVLCMLNWNSSCLIFSMLSQNVFSMSPCQSSVFPSVTMNLQFLSLWFKGLLQSSWVWMFIFTWRIILAQLWLYMTELGLYMIMTWLYCYDSLIVSMTL
jgi:hypothetical protein